MDFIIYFAICICAVAFFAVYIGKTVKKYKQNETEKMKPTEDVNEIKSEFTTIKTKAKVIDLTCRVEMVGVKTPKTVEIFTVVFETDDKEIIEINTSQEMYEGFEKGQYGELTLADGELYSFII
ncbi:MAG: hypothetical protein IJZ57_08140 [Clostridia bacterium]|nr:hypothetical protein [Clostridia bacterium]